MYSEIADCGGSKSCQRVEGRELRGEVIRHGPSKGGNPMSIITILIIVILVLLALYLVRRVV